MDSLPLLIILTSFPIKIEFSLQIFTDVFTDSSLSNSSYKISKLFNKLLTSSFLFMYLPTSELIEVASIL